MKNKKKKIKKYEKQWKIREENKTKQENLKRYIFRNKEILQYFLS